jgi:ribonuclease T1
VNQARLRTVLTVLAAVVVLLVVWRAPSLLGGADPGPGDRSATSDSASAPRTDPDSGLPFVEVGALPPEARTTLALIDAGGPFPYDQDGATFFNNEQNLPDHDRGYYREYTVETPGSRDRGARRIVAGAEGELYWTEDHYDSFERIRR